MTPLELIGESIQRLVADYDTALALVGGDESMVTMQLPAEWSVLVRRVCALITVEADRRAATRAALEPVSLEPCMMCGAVMWFVHVEPATLHRAVRCASCGMACHV